ncbi:MAG: hypothetical protein NZM06_02370 [Chloroherpetonaceae bacterium]|nr:hypothetical protein [Chloroherpetonaceae bacterium]MDW8436528.1 hypothetical protein [Chloroherpetonaceae bacterium]
MRDDDSPNGASLDERWRQFETLFESKFQKKPTIESAFFVIGLQHGFARQPLDKSDKEKLIAEGFRIAFAKQGYFSRNADGTWREEKPFPTLDGEARDDFFREAILSYFQR